MNVTPMDVIVVGASVIAGAIVVVGLWEVAELLHLRLTARPRPVAAERSRVVATKPRSATDGTITLGPFTVPHTAEERKRLYLFQIVAEAYGYEYQVVRVDARDGNPGFVTATVWPHKQSTKHAQGAHS